MPHIDFTLPASRFAPLNSVGPLKLESAIDSLSLIDCNLSINPVDYDLYPSAAAGSCMSRPERIKYYYPINLIAEVVDKHVNVNDVAIGDVINAPLAYAEQYTSNAPGSPTCDTLWDVSLPFGTTGLRDLNLHYKASPVIGYFGHILFGFIMRIGIQYYYWREGVSPGPVLVALPTDRDSDPESRQVEVNSSAGVSRLYNQFAAPPYATNIRWIDVELKVGPPIT